MMFKIYVPLLTAEIIMPECIAFLYPFYNTSKTKDEKVKQFGDWFLNVEITHVVQECDAIMLPYNIGYYYKHKQLAHLKTINELSSKHHKLIICATKGDLEVTPNFANYHLYRHGGYASKNKGAHFCYPVFVQDPAANIFNGQLPVPVNKTAKPIIGFCGQAKGGAKKWATDIGRGLYRRMLKWMGKWPYDNETLESTTLKRAHILHLLEKSPLVQTNFIKHTKYRGGVKTKEAKEENTRMFFNNMQQSQYIVCYRGAGNYSVRLYETLATGRIPIIVKSDNLMPLANEIDWHMFPVVEENNIGNIAQTVASFHASLSNEQFIQLQQEARRIWQTYLTYKGFMARWLEKYVQNS